MSLACSPRSWRSGPGLPPKAPPEPGPPLRTEVSEYAYASVAFDRAARSSRPRDLVLEHFGARAGCAWRETDEQDTDEKRSCGTCSQANTPIPSRLCSSMPLRAGPGTRQRTLRMRSPTEPPANGWTSHPHWRLSSNRTPRVLLACNSHCRCAALLNCARSSSALA